MEKGTYKIYAGLGGGFGGANYITTEDNLTEDEAYQWAYEEACEIYESYSTNVQARGISQIMEEEDCDESDAEDYYNNERENWLSYYIEKVED